MKFDQLLLRKIFLICCKQMSDFKAKCTKFDFGWGSAPDPTGGAYSASPGLLADLRGLLLREENVWEKGMGRNESGQKRREFPRVGSHPMSEILKNTLIAKLIW